MSDEFSAEYRFEPRAAVDANLLFTQLCNLKHGKKSIAQYITEAEGLYRKCLPNPNVVYAPTVPEILELCPRFCVLPDYYKFWALATGLAGKHALWRLDFNKRNQIPGDFVPHGAAAVVRGQDRGLRFPVWDRIQFHGDVGVRLGLKQKSEGDALGDAALFQRDERTDLRTYHYSSKVDDEFVDVTAAIFEEVNIPPSEDPEPFVKSRLRDKAENVIVGETENKIIYANIGGYRNFKHLDEITREINILTAKYNGEAHKFKGNPKREYLSTTPLLYRKCPEALKIYMGNQSITGLSDDTKSVTVQIYLFQERKEITFPAAKVVGVKTYSLIGRPSPSDANLSQPNGSSEVTQGPVNADVLDFCRSLKKGNQQSAQSVPAP
ncbi:hypothetical protein BDR22DRAFT_921316 [Usnea florida]